MEVILLADRVLKLKVLQDYFLPKATAISAHSSILGYVGLFLGPMFMYVLTKGCN